MPIQMFVRSLNLFCVYVFDTQGIAGARGLQGPRGAAGREVCECVCVSVRKYIIRYRQSILKSMPLTAIYAYI